MRFALAVGLLLSATVSWASPWDIPAPPRGQWVLDRTSKLSGSTVSEVNRLAAALDSAGAGQLGVLVTDSTQGVNPRDFATGVFNNWGVGHAGANDGVLLFIAVNDRKAEIVLGDGSRVQRSQTDAVMRDAVVSNMKRSDLDGAVRSAAHALDGVMRSAAGRAAAPSSQDNTGLGPDAYVTPSRGTTQVDAALSPYGDGSKSFPERSPRSWVVDLSDALNASQRAQLDVAASDLYSGDQGRIFFLVMNSNALYPSLPELTARLVRQVRTLSKLPMAVIALDLNGPVAKIHLPEAVVTNEWERQQVALAEQELASTASVDRVSAMLAAQRFVQRSILTGIPPRPASAVLEEGFQRNKGRFQLGGGGFLVAGLFLARRWNRKRTRHCEDCKHPRQLLGDAAEDQHLDSSQLKEESIGSVDYDVWWCGRCEDALVLRYGAIFTSYSKCPQCSAKTKSSSTTTLSYATEYSGGSQRIDERCANCSFTNSFVRATARLSKSSSSSSSSSSRSSSSSSFGGGSSSGRGSSGSW